MNENFRKPRLPQRTPKAVAASVDQQKRRTEILAEFKQQTKPVRLIGLSDATGSMTGVWQQTRSHIGKMLTRVSQIGAVEIRWAAYRDYGDGNALLEASDWSTKSSVIEAFVRKISCHGGYDWEEAVEYALKWAADDGTATRITLIGDAPPHPERDYREQAKRLRDAGTPVYSFVVGGNEDTFKRFLEISQITGGLAAHLRSDQDLLDCIGLAVADDLGGASAVRDFIKDYNAQLSAGTREYAKLLLSSGAQ